METRVIKAEDLNALQGLLNRPTFQLAGPIAPVDFGRRTNFVIEEISQPFGGQSSFDRSTQHSTNSAPDESAVSRR